MAQLGNIVPPPAPVAPPAPVPAPDPVPVPPAPLPPAVIPPITLPADTSAPVISGVASLSLGLNEATLVWATDELAVSRIEYGTTTNYGIQPTLAISALLAHTAILTGLSAGTTYYYCIHATDLAGNTANSCSHSFATASVPILTDTTPPDITLISVLPITTSSATINWTTTEVANSQIEFGLTAGYGSQTPFDATLSLTHTVTLSNLTPNTLYHYRIRTGDEIGNETIGSDETFTTEAAVSGNVSLEISDTTAPQISEAGTASIGLTDATIVWTTNEPALSTLEYGLTTGYGSHAALSSSLLLIHAATLTGLQSGATYYYCIHATDLAGNTANSCSRSFTTISASAPPDTTPPMISVTAASTVTATTATVAWTTNKPANAKVEYGLTLNYGSETTLEPLLELTHSVVINGLLPGTTYHYRVRSADDAGNMSLGSDATFTTSALNAEELQEEIQAITSGAIITSIETTPITASTATISWLTDLPSDSQVEYGENENFGSFTELNSNLATSHSATLTGLSAGTNYIFRVRSKPMGALTATVSANYEFDTLSISSPVAAPANISSVSFSQVTASGATVSWTTDRSATSEVEYGISTAYGQSSGLNLSMQTSHSLALTDLTPGTTYHFRARSADEDGNVTFSEDYTFVTSAAGDSSNQIPVSAPAAMTTLAIGGYDESSVELIWHVGSEFADASQEYDIRYSSFPITNDNFDAALRAQTTPVFRVDLSPEGAERAYIVAGLSPNTTYYFALKSKYENSSYSGPSNLVQIATTADTSVDENVNANIGSPSGGSSVGGVPADAGTGATAYGEYGAASGGNAAYSAEPTLIKATPADNEIIFTWKNPGEANFVRTVIVRKDGGYPSSPSDGTTLYEGRAETFTDTNAVNGRTYYYSFYAYNHSKTYSSPIRVSLAPNAGNKQSIFEEAGSIMQKLAVAHFTRIFKKGDKDVEIEHLQELLSADNDAYPEKYVTGYFGRFTQAALKRFQAKHGLAQTGITDQATQNKLNAIAASEKRLEVPEDYALFSTNLKLGMQNETVRALQTYLAYEGSLAAASVNGYFGPETKTAVKAFQKKYGIRPVSGYVGIKTRHIMRKLAGL